jgi:pseudouridine-5'-phosphate glycosidase
MALEQTCATTVASSMAIAARARIRTFATGGIGGVHRDVAKTFDESADLFALQRFPVLVVSAGPKAVLDLRRTMERLETLGVPVIGYRTRELPAFYHGTSGIKLEHVVEKDRDLASVMRARFDHLREGGILAVQPPPPEVAQDPNRVADLIDMALDEAKHLEVSGAALTPFLMSRLDAHSSGSVVETNVALVIRNARLAARVAVAYAAMRAERTDPEEA